MSANNFKLTLDTIAPTTTITYPTGALLNTNTTVTATFGSDTAVNYMKVWYDTSASTSTAPAGATWEVYSNSKVISFSANGNYYIHAIFLDDVGNQSSVQHSGQIRYETVAPTIGTCYAEDLDSHSHAYINDSTFKIHLEATDGGTVASGLDRVVITGPFTGSPKTIQAASFTSGAYEEELTIAAGTTEGSKTISVVAYDLAGNSSTLSGGISFYYDPNISSVTAILKATAAATEQLPQYINASTNSFVAVITTTDTDIVEYALYGDVQNHTTESWTAWPTPGATSITVSGLAFTTSDGTKNVYVKVKDAAGNIATAPLITRVYDATIPALTISAAHSWIASGNGIRNSTTITYTASDATSGLDGNSPSFTCNGSTIANVSGGSFTFSANTPGATTGANTIRITATDNAGNTTYQEVIVNIEASFTIDSVVLGGYDLYAYDYNGTSKDNITATVNNTSAPGSGRSRLYVWTNTTADDTEVPAGASSGVAWGSASQTIASASIDKSMAPTAGNYLHVKAVSTVGNVAYAHVNFTVDETAPTYTAAGSGAHLNTKTNIITLSSGSDDLSGLDKMKLVAGDGTTLKSGAFDWTNYADGQLTVILGDAVGDGNYSVIISVRDRANNITTKTISWEYDHTAPEGNIVLKEADGTSNKASPSADNQFKVLVGYTVDSTDSFAAVAYKIWGDFNTTEHGSATTEQEAQWTPMTGTTTLTGLLYCTDNPAGSSADGLVKTVYAKLKDDAGNETTLTAATFRYNPNSATLTISNITHNRISCTHVERKTSSGSTVSDVTGDYADLMSFTVTSDQTIVEWKIAAYQAGHYPASDTRGNTVTPITKLTGSHSSTGYTASSVSVSSWIVEVDGTDYRNALGGSASVNVDGIHYVVAFAKNEAGVWSIAGTAVTN